MGIDILGRRLRLALVMGIALILSACSGNVDSVDARSSGMSLSGSVGDGPIVDAVIQIVDAQDQLVMETSSDLTAGYQLEIPDGTPLPVIASATGGTDMVNGRPAEFPLQAIAFESGPLTLNMTPYTTLALKIAQCRNEVNPNGLDQAWRDIAARLNLGWRTDVVADPMRDPIDAGNVATVLLSNEALGEVIRRTANGLINAGFPIEQEAVLDQLACDIADGSLDASHSDADVRVAATLLAAASSVQIEVISGQLHVDDQPVAALLDAAARVVVPDTDAAVLQVLPPEELLTQAETALAVLQGTWPDDDLMQLQLVLADAGETTARSMVAQTMDTSSRDDLDGLIERVALADEQVLDETQQRMSRVEQADAPILSMSAQPAIVDAGASVTLSWASADADQCEASGGWSGSRSGEGVYVSEPLTSRSTFTLSCTGLGGSVVDQVVVDVASATSPAPEQPMVNLSASSANIAAGDSVSLSWNVANADSCAAAGGWQGNRNMTGSMTIGPLNTTTSFTLNCSGAGGNASDSVTVIVNQPQPAPRPVVSLSAARSAVDSGQSTTLSWTSSNAQSCVAGGDWSGNKATSGSQSSGILDGNATFTLSCSGTGGTASDSVTVTVNQPPQPAPVVNLNVAAGSVNYGQSTSLSWTASNADTCVATGGWSGSRGSSGSASTGALTRDTGFTLSCSGAGGSSSDSVTVRVNAAPPVTVNFSSVATVVDRGTATTLNWSSTNADSCSASGGWNGARATSGSQSTGPLNAGTAFTLTCSGAGGSAVQMIQISTLGSVTLNWQAPTENVDGSPLTDLSGYRVYYGEDSRTYPGRLDINDASATSATLDLVSGTYYVAMTALDAEGNESGYSNEVVKMLP